MEWVKITLTGRILWNRSIEVKSPLFPTCNIKKKKQLCQVVSVKTLMLPSKTEPVKGSIWVNNMRICLTVDLLMSIPRPYQLNSTSCLTCVSKRTKHMRLAVAVRPVVSSVWLQTERDQRGGTCCAILLLVVFVCPLQLSFPVLLWENWRTEHSWVRESQRRFMAQVWTSDLWPRIICLLVKESLPPWHVPLLRVDKNKKTKERQTRGNFWWSRRLTCPMFL